MLKNLDARGEIIRGERAINPDQAKIIIFNLQSAVAAISRRRQTKVERKQIVSGA